MNLPLSSRRHRALRVVLCVGMVGYAAVVASVLISGGGAKHSLPGTTPAALVAALKKPSDRGFEGTLVSRLAPGLPDVPAAHVAGGGSSMSGRLAGTHTLQVWYGGTDRQRVALLGADDETDLIRHGQQLWRWSTASRLAVHDDLPATPQDSGLLTVPIPTTADLLSLTPDGLARTAIASIDGSTDVTVADDREVADRDVYDLTLTPTAGSTRVGSVHIAVDGETKVPLGVQIYASADANTAAVDVAFTRFRYGQPADRNFRFAPPSDAKVENRTAGQDAAPEFQGATATSSSQVSREESRRPLAPSGSGWVAVAAYRRGDASDIEGGTRVSGTWGRGLVLESALFSVLITDDGRVYSGSVAPDALYAAAGNR